MQVYLPLLRHTPNKASVLKTIRAYRRLAKAIVNAGFFDTKNVENIAFLIIYIVIILAVGGLVVAEVFGLIGSSLPTIGQTNPLYNSTMKVISGLTSLGGLFSSGVGLITILILISVVAVIIVTIKDAFGGRAGT